jgi:branched-chain amino acid transport system ATP-binding protein
MILDIQNLEVSYGKIRAIKGISLHVNQGEVVVLVGANGAGKTTLLKTISGLLNPSNGSIKFQGLDLTKIAPHQRVISWNDRRRESPNRKVQSRNRKN